jgi:hypothetical protein
MSEAQRVYRTLLAALAGVLLMSGAAATLAQADPYGELQHFSGSGTALGQLNEPEPALGVDPEDNSVFVVDSPAHGNGLRLQKFIENTTTHKYEAVASIAFKPAGQNPEEGDEVEGIAVDTKLNRVYLLASQHRPEKAKEPDPEVLAAGILYAFKTTNVANKLEFAAETSEGVVANNEVLQTKSTVPGAAILEPSGIAVDPTNGDVIIAGTEDRGKKPFEQEYTTVLQRVTSKGVLGARYVDSREELNPETNKVEEKSFFEECDCANSPVVTSAGHVYVVNNENQILEIPADFNGATAPKPVAGCGEECGNELVTAFPGEVPESGGQMSIGPEGRIYVFAKITDASSGFKYGGAVVFNEQLVEEGWTGGQNQASQAGKCIFDGTQEPAIGAGKENKLFGLERNSSGPEPPRIIEFGPGGSGCPAASATVPSEAAGGVVNVEPVPIGEKVTLSSKVTQANALRTEWEFGDGSPNVETGAQHQTTEVIHKFASVGKHTVKETIHTDDLATPVITVERKIEIVGGPKVITEAEPKNEGTSVTLRGTVNPNGEAITACEFEYGPSTSYGSHVPCAGVPPAGEEPKPVSAKITAPRHVEIHYRLKATSAAKTEFGNDETFTIANKPVAITGNATFSQTTATLNATVNPEGAEVTGCKFVYGPTTSYGAEKGCTTLPGGKGEAAVAVTAAVSGLSPGTSYHYKIVATNSLKETGEGLDATFRTTPSTSGGGGGGGGGSTTSTASPAAGPSAPAGGVLPTIQSKPPGVPIATIAGSSALVSSVGAFTLKVGCPTAESSCTGTIVLRTVKAVVASAGHEAKSKAIILMLAAGSFTVVGGRTKTITLHLSVKGRSLLAHAHTVFARVTISAHDPAGAKHTTLVNVTLRPAKKPKHH